MLKATVLSLAALTVSFTCTAKAVGISADSIITVNSIAPSVNGDDIANLAPPTSLELIWLDRQTRGQTFTSPATGGRLQAVTVQLDETVDGLIDGWKDYLLRVGTVDFGGASPAINPLYVSIDRYEPDAPADSYFTFTLEIPLTLSPSALYGFDFGLYESEQRPFVAGIPSILTTDDLYDGGERFFGAITGTIDGVSGLPNQIVPEAGDLVFHLDIQPIPEPGTLLLIAGMVGLAALRLRA